MFHLNQLQWRMDTMNKTLSCILQNRADRIYGFNPHSLMYDEISGFHGDENVDCGLLCCDAV
jgi:hypothetical protein